MSYNIINIVEIVNYPHQDIKTRIKKFTSLYFILNKLLSILSFEILNTMRYP